ncbi:hypothetical protein N9L52_07825 [Litoricolaceae bacterium]|jgi:hypothetical protein|nr:hypothetical protein [Litorivicinaceae bacterium]
MIEGLSVVEDRSICRHEVMVVRLFWHGFWVCVIRITAIERIAFFQQW